MTLQTIFILVSMGFPPLRPPEPVVPFIYDPNQVNFEIIEARREYPHTNKDISFHRVIYEPDGQSVSLSCSAAYVNVGSPVISIDPNDPNGLCLKYEYNCVIEGALAHGIYYIDFTAIDNDPNEPMSDSRTVLLYIWPKNRPPVIGK